MCSVLRDADGSSATVSQYTTPRIGVHHASAYMQDSDMLHHPQFTHLIPNLETRSARKPELPNNIRWDGRVRRVHGRHVEGEDVGSTTGADEHRVEPLNAKRSRRKSSGLYCSGCDCVSERGARVRLTTQNKHTPRRVSVLQGGAPAQEIFTRLTSRMRVRFMAA
jgi:hypothetical protein